jgi:hypothetical protein
MMENIDLYLGVAPRQPDSTQISTALMAMKPTFGGTVSIPSKDSSNKPVIDPNYFSTKVYKHVWRVSLRRIALLIVGDTPLGREVVESETPPTDDLESFTADASDEYLDDIVNSRAV